MTEPVAAAEEGDPKLDSAAFRRCLGQFATGVTVITARSGERLVGMTVNSFASVSLNPPLVLWSAKRKSPSFDAFTRAGHFAINVLSKDQIGLSTHFGKSGEDKFVEVAHSAGIGGSPLLDGAVATFECRRCGDFDGGDHLVILGEVERFRRYDNEALVFSQGRYSLAADYEAGITVSGSGAQPASPQGPMNDFMTALLYRAHGVISAAVEEGRQAEGLTLLQSRLMAAIETLPGNTLEELLPELFLGSNAAENTVEQLKEMGIVAADENGRLNLTASGRVRNRSLLARARSIENRMIAGASAADIAACRRVLTYLASQLRPQRRDEESNTLHRNAR